MMPRPIEVTTCRERGRRWDPDVRTAIMTEALKPGAVILQVARRHDMGPQQLFGWLREARKTAEASVVSFVPVVVEAPIVEPPPAPKPKARRRRAREGLIELEIDGVAVRVGRGAETKTVAAVIQALKGAR